MDLGIKREVRSVFRLFSWWYEDVNEIDFVEIKENRHEGGYNEKPITIYEKWFKNRC